MLHITHAAGDVIGGLAGEPAGPPQGGLRITWSQRDGDRAGLTLAVAARPSDSDEVITSPTGAHVFVEPEAARYLADKVLDVRKDVDGRFHFAFHDKH